jgi:hypothetical protein
MRFLTYTLARLIIFFPSYPIPERKAVAGELDPAIETRNNLEPQQLVNPMTLLRRERGESRAMPA